MLNKTWDVTHNFKSKQHIDNYIAKVESTGLHSFDEIFIEDPIDQFIYDTAKQFQPKK
tara:strand:- start:242 stop:415 length:174 start_codon:yes stop_codon:yes gene_type:complete